MTEPNIHIENLHIRLPLVPFGQPGQAGQVHAMAETLGREILHALAEATEGKSGTLKVGAIATKMLDMQAQALGNNKRVAGLVAEALLDKLG